MGKWMGKKGKKKEEKYKFLSFLFVCFDDGKEMGEKLEFLSCVLSKPNSSRIRYISIYAAGGGNCWEPIHQKRRKIRRVITLLASNFQ
jgi:hypothetical protein